VVSYQCLENILQLVLQGLIAGRTQQRTLHILREGLRQRLWGRRLRRTGRTRANWYELLLLALLGSCTAIACSDARSSGCGCATSCGNLCSI
jgi:hypothetical protein